MLELYYYTLIISVTAFTWVNFLVSADDILAFIPTLYWKSLDSSDKLVQTLGKVLFQCEKCLSGQLALWYYVGLVITGHDYQFIEHCFFIIITVFITGWMASIHKSL